MKNLLEKYLLCSIARDGEAEGGAGGAASTTVTPPAGESSAPAAPAGEPAKAAGTMLGGAVAAAAEAKAAEAKPAEYVADPAKSDEENAAAKTAHDAAEAERTKAKEPAKPDDKKADDKAKDEADTPEAIEARAKAYQIDVPEGFELDAEIEKPFREFGAKHKLTQDDIKELAGLQVKLYEKQAAAHADQVTKWGDEIKANKEIGGAQLEANLGKAALVINEFFPPEVATLFDKTGIGNHPGLALGFVRLGKAFGELPTMRNRAGGGAKEDIIDVLYPKQSA